jgi:diacylglycerol O-acyltransferase-1
MSRPNGATVTSVETSPGANDVVSRRPTSQPSARHVPNGNSSSINGNEGTKELRKSLQKKYRHVAAVHSKTRPSCLSHDATETPSFLGFRNLMVIVLGE